MFLDLTDLEAGHLARAIRFYADRLRIDAMRLPAGLLELEACLAARNGQQQSEMDSDGGLPDAAGVMPILYEIRDAADALSLSTSSVSRLIRGGELRSVKVGKLRRIPRQDLLDFVEALRKDQTDATKA